MKRFFKQILAFFPSKLPTGVQEFNNWVESFFEIYQLPTQDVASVKAAVAMMIAHSDTSKLFLKGVYRSKFYFYLQLHMSASRQVALSVHKELYNQFKEKNNTKEINNKLPTQSSISTVGAVSSSAISNEILQN